MNVNLLKSTPIYGKHSNDDYDHNGGVDDDDVDVVAFRPKQSLLWKSKALRLKYQLTSVVKVNSYDFTL